MKILGRAERRKKRISSNLLGKAACPRISVFASHRYTYAQAIDDEKDVTLAAYSSLQFSKFKEYKKDKKTLEAKKIGLGLAKIMKDKGIIKAIFDRGVYSYKGRVKALAEGLREGGIKI